MNIPPSISHFPITEHLEKITSTLKASPSHALVLTAETGAGKSTVLPLALLQEFSASFTANSTSSASTSTSSRAKILMTEPRRLAVVGVANRLAEELEEAPGSRIGYRIHLENRISSETRLEVMTEGILIRMLQSDPALEGVNLVILDEFHERSINTDLALAFLREAMELRDDLFILIMSATIESKKIAAFLGQDTPVLEIPGRTFPVDIQYQPDMTIDDAVLSAIEKQLPPAGGDATGKAILCFLPGIREIRSAQASLSQSLKSEIESGKIEICILHSSISFSEQKHILTPPTAGTIRIILSSAIAETSLTLPGVVCVIDSGLSRVNRINLSTGMENLVTEAESEFSAAQRAGRAGREREGSCIRLWNKFDVRQKEVQPEILRTDLTQLVLECSERGIYDLSKIQLLDSPTQNAWEAAAEFLKETGCIDENLRITERGQAALSLGISIRLALITIDGYQNSDKKQEKFSAKTSEYLLKFSQYAQNSPKIQNQFLANLEEKLNKICKNSQNFEQIQSKSANFEENFHRNPLILLSGFPDRLALRLSEFRKNSDGSASPLYQFPSGRKAVLHNSKHTNAKWIVAPEVMAGQSEGVIFDFEELSDPQAEGWLESRAQSKIICRFEKGKIIKTENLCYGQILLSSKKLLSTKEDYAAAWMTEIRTKGMEALPLDEKCENFLERIKFLAQQNPQDNNLADKITGLPDKPESWLLPFIISNSLTSQTIYEALNYFFGEFNIEESVPLQINLQNGNRAKIKYEKLASPDDKTRLVIRPVIEIIIQRAFGCQITPKIAGMKVLFRLLSPAQRPLQITDDLEGFWSTTWPEICREMKGRYPKHNWDWQGLN